MEIQRLSAAGCRANAREWRAEADHLREMAENDRLPPPAKALLRREAEAADRRSLLWLSAAREEAGLTDGATPPT